MKKIISIIVLVCLVFTGTMTTFAQYVSREDMGISFSLSDSWIKDYDEADLLGFYHYLNGNESVVVEILPNDLAWHMDLIDDSLFFDICEEIYSNSEIAYGLSSDNNGVYVTVTTDSVITGYEYYNNVKYYRYEKAYTARAAGYNDTPFYETVFVTVKNGNFYFISYQRDDLSNHFNDIAYLLDSVSFESGEIKIEINGSRIYPDSAPMLIADRTLVPIRAIAEAMDYFVGWNEENQLVTLESIYDGTILQFVIGSDVAYKNYTEEILLDVPAIEIGGRTYLPLRAVAEAMDAYVNWNDPEKTVEISY